VERTARSTVPLPQPIDPNGLLNLADLTHRTSVTRLDWRSKPRLVGVELATYLVQAVEGGEVGMGRCALHQVGVETAFCRQYRLRVTPI
jgi:hypothetical protein